MKIERNTKQKEEVIKFLKNNKNRHVTINEIEESLSGKVGQTTIYRIINSLIKKGEVIKMPLESKQGLPQLVEFAENGDFESDEVNNVIKEAISTKEFAINNEKIAFFGKCKECRNEK